MSRESFWSMHPIEFHLLMEVWMPRKMYGDLSEAEVAAIYEEAYPNG